eukprot:1306842-Alexandrium_andersonii.AAC.1
MFLNREAHGCCVAPPRGRAHSRRAVRWTTVLLAARVTREGKLLDSTARELVAALRNIPGASPRIGRACAFATHPYRTA